MKARLRSWQAAKVQSQAAYERMLLDSTPQFIRAETFGAIQSADRVIEKLENMIREVEDGIR
jgi:hypothetical protein